MRSALVVFLLFLFATALGAAEPKVVRNSAQGLWDENPRKSFGLLEELIVGGDDEESDVIFGTITDIVVDSRGRVIVLDGGYTRVTIYDPDSMNVRFVGRRGEGPGEFNQPTAIGVDAQDRIYVASMGGRVAIFTRNGVVAEEFRQKVADGYTTGLCPTDAGLYITCFDEVDDKVIHRYDATHRYVSSFSDSWSATEVMPLDVARWCNGGAIDIGQDGSVYYTQFTPYEIRKFSPTGDLLLTIHRENDFKPPRVERSGDSVAFYNYSGSFGVFVLSDGRILNVVSRVGDTHRISSTVFDLFGADGRLLKSLERDGRVGMKFRDAQGRLFASEERGVPQVVRYRLGFK